MISIQCVETRRFVALAPEELHDAHAADVLLEIRVDSREPCSDLSIGSAHRSLEYTRRQPHEGNHRKGCQRESPVGDEHQHADRDEREQVAHSRHDARGEELIQGLDVGRDPRDEAPDRVPVEERDRKLLQVGKQLMA